MGQTFTFANDQNIGKISNVSTVPAKVNLFVYRSNFVGKFRFLAGYCTVTLCEQGKNFADQSFNGNKIRQISPV